MELRGYLRIVQRWAWLLILGLVLGAAGGYFFSRYQTPVYQASTRAMVMRPAQEGVSDYTYLSGQQLTQTYHSTGDHPADPGCRLGGAGL